MSSSTTLSASAGKRKSTQTVLTFQVSEKRNKIAGAVDEPSSITDDMETDTVAPPPPAIGLRKVGGSTGPKRLVVKDFKVKPKLPEDFEETTWQKLREAVVAVQKRTAVSCSLEELYKAVENMCIHKLAPSLFDKLQQVCEAHIAGEVHRLLGQTSDPAQFLILVNACWKDHCEQMHMIRSIFLYLDRTYVLQTPARSIWDTGLRLFRQHVAGHPEVERKTISALLHQIDTERRGEMVDRMLLHAVLRMLLAVNMYTDHFQRPFLEATTLFYRAESARLLASSEVPEYLLHAQTRLDEEAARVQHYLDAQTRRPLVAAVEHELLEQHVDELLSKGFEPLMAATRTADLARMYRLLGRVGAQDRMRAALLAYTKKVGSALVTDTSHDDTLVQELLDFKARLDGLLEHAFEQSEPFAHAVRDAFEAFINMRQNKPAELIAKFVDSKLRSGGGRGLSEDELEAVLERVIVLFRFIHGKDVFEAFYKKDLAKRLLLGKSASTDAERAMIQKLKTECGAGFTAKLEGMFKDMELSRDIMAGFRAYVAQQEREGALPRVGDVELTVHVLTTTYWPNYTPVEVVLPVELSRLQEAFQRFYASKHSGRRLTWQNTLGSTVLKATFAKGKKELALSLFQTAVLMLYNDTDSLQYEDIATATKLEEGELKRTLQSLACGTLRILNKSTEAAEVRPGDVFTFNAQFTHKLYRIKVNALQVVETPQEQKETQESVFQDRQYQIDAALVRIMKARKSLGHQLLLAELFKQLRFPFKAVDVKKRIDSLIEREYLERDREDPQTYHYLA